MNTLEWGIAWLYQAGAGYSLYRQIHCPGIHFLRLGTLEIRF